MADRVSATITLGGTLSAGQVHDLAAVINAEGLSTEWDGEAFAIPQLVPESPLALMAHEVAWGRFEDLEAFCISQGLPFVRWSGAYAGQWGAERVVFSGSGDARSFTANEEDTILIDRDTIDRLGTIEAVRAHFDAAEFNVPPLRIEC